MSTAMTSNFASAHDVDAPPADPVPLPIREGDDNKSTTKHPSSIHGSPTKHQDRACVVVTLCVLLCVATYIVSAAVTTGMWADNYEANYQARWQYYKAHVPVEEFRDGFSKTTKHWLKQHPAPIPDPAKTTWLGAAMWLVWFGAAVWPLVILMVLAKCMWKRMKRSAKGSGKADEEEGIELEDWTGRPTTNPYFKHADSKAHGDGDEIWGEDDKKKGGQDCGIVWPIASLHFDKDAVIVGDVKGDGVDTEISIREGEWSDVDIEVPQPVRLV